MTRYTLLAVVILLLLAGCDLDKFIGYRIQSESLPVLARIFGTITSKNTTLPVDGAQIQIENQAAFSDERGEYIFYYYQTADNLRDKPVPVRISADRFLTVDTAIVVYTQTRLDLQLTYGAPIIKRSALVEDVCQVIVFDYQGAEDISEVNVNLIYHRPGDKAVSLRIDKSLDRVTIDSVYYAYYQAIVDTVIPGYGNLSAFYYIRATDTKDYVDSVSSAMVGETVLLFPSGR
jgi:hypothetical protein